MLLRVDTTEGSLAGYRPRLAASANEMLEAWTATTLANKVKQTVIGQDRAVERMCTAVWLGILRSKLIAEGKSASDLPNTKAFMCIGPTGTGKTFIIRTIAKALGIQMHAINGANLTGAGWRGGDIDAELMAVGRLQARTGDVVLVFIDESDKLVKGSDERYKGFDPCANLLALIEGDEVVSLGTGQESGSFDQAGVVYVLAGAFSGIEDIVRSRLVAADGGSGAGFGSTLARTSFQKMTEAELRDKITTDDLISWGYLAELVGRLHSIVPLNPLGREEYRRIVTNPHGGTLARYNNIAPDGVEVSLANSAIDLISDQAERTGRGARGIESALAEVLDAAISFSHENDDIIGVEVIDEGGGLGVRYERGKRVSSPRPSKPSDGAVDEEEAEAETEEEESEEVLEYTAKSEEAVKFISVGAFSASDNSASVSLVGSTTPLEPYPSTYVDPLWHGALERLFWGEASSRELAGELFCDYDKDLLECVSCYEEAETVALGIANVACPNADAFERRCLWELLCACIELLLDWFGEDDRRMANIKELLGLMDTDARPSGLDLLFLEIGRGEKLEEGPDGYSWSRTVPTKMVSVSTEHQPSEMRDHEVLGRYRGLDISEDEALAHWARFKVLSAGREREFARALLPAFEKISTE